MNIAADALARIEEHAQEAAPDECCGLLVGTTGAILDAVRARNTADEPHRRYLIEPQDYFQAIRHARARQAQVVGAYHSHPQSEPIPSETDRLQAFEHFLFVIVGRSGDTEDRPFVIRAWRFSSGNFVEVSLVRLP